MLLQFLNVNLNELKITEKNSISQSVVAPSKELSSYLWLLDIVSKGTALEDEIHED